MLQAYHTAVIKLLQSGFIGAYGFVFIYENKGTLLTM